MVGRFEKLGLENSNFAMGLPLQFQHNCAGIRLDLLLLTCTFTLQETNESVYVTAKDANLIRKELSRIIF